MYESQLDPILKRDCHIMAKNTDSWLLLMDNTLIPWFIIVPKTEQTQLHLLPKSQQLKIFEYTNLVANFVYIKFPVTQINTAAIGNVVKQLHVHIVGRDVSDAFWPNVVWGQTNKKSYEPHAVLEIKQMVKNSLNHVFVIYEEE